MDLGKRAAAIVAAAVGIVLLAATMPEDAEAHGRRGHGHGGSVVVVGGGGYWGAPYWAPYWGFGFGWGPYFGGLYPPILGVDMNLAAANGMGVIDLHVKPGEAELWVDGKFYGEAKDYDGTPTFLWLKEGPHHLVIYRGGYKRFEEDIEALGGQFKELKVRLEKGASEPPGTRPGAERPSGKPARTESDATD